MNMLCYHCSLTLCDSSPENSLYMHIDSLKRKILSYSSMYEFFEYTKSYWSKLLRATIENLINLWLIDSLIELGIGNLLKLCDIPGRESISLESLEIESAFILEICIILCNDIDIGLCCSLDSVIESIGFSCNNILYSSGNQDLTYHGSSGRLYHRCLLAKRYMLCTISYIELYHTIYSLWDPSRTQCESYL